MAVAVSAGDIFPTEDIVAFMQRGEAEFLQGALMSEERFLTPRRVTHELPEGYDDKSARFGLVDQCGKGLRAMFRERNMVQEAEGDGEVAGRRGELIVQIKFLVQRIQDIKVLVVHRGIRGRQLIATIYRIEREGSIRQR